MSEQPLSSERAARRRAIRVSAIQTLSQHGFFASRTRDIGARAGVAEGTRILVGSLEEIELDWLPGGRTRPLSPLPPQVAATLSRGFTAEPRDG